MEELRSSADWAFITGVIIMDPDGWDRRNFQESWLEKISLAEFKRRAFMSTVNFRSFPEDWKM